jgi:arsenite methyltransferase
VKAVNVKSTAAVDDVVRARYSSAARAREQALCCPTAYDPRLLDAIPAEVLERDYGCGDPSRYLRAGETVLDLGSGTGKIGFIAAQVVGPHGRVIGVDMNDDMLAVARGAAPTVAARIGYSNVEFRKGRIQDLALDLELLDHWLREHPVRSAGELDGLERHIAALRGERPLIADQSVDVAVSNCVLNLVGTEEKRPLFAEIFRVVRRGGRAVISDIVASADVPEHLQRDPELWSGCVSGAMREDRFTAAFEAAGFYGIEIVARQAEPWRVVDGIELRSVTVVAYRGKEGPCLDQGHAVVYRGPFRQVEDDDGHVFRRGVHTPVCEKTFHIFAKEPYRAHVALVDPDNPVPLDEAPPFACGPEGSCC